MENRPADVNDSCLFVFGIVNKFRKLIVI